MHSSSDPVKKLSKSYIYIFAVVVVGQTTQAAKGFKGLDAVQKLSVELTRLYS